jgi:pimeloyl-ACP methyl ester carboxylesterase
VQLPDDGRILLILVPGAGITAPDFEAQGFIDAINQRGDGISVVAIDPGMDAYLDGSVETRALAAIDQARREAGAARVWLAGISLGCQAILRCMRRRPGLAEGLILLTPYLASTGVIAEVSRAGGLRCWAETPGVAETQRDPLLSWLAAGPAEALSRILLGYARADRFAATATLLADLLPAHRVASVPGAHDWESWRELWRLVLDGKPFGWPILAADKPSAVACAAQ